jgi:hypothetical protein
MPQEIGTMNTPTDNTRHFLSYSGATYRPTRNWFIAAVILLVASIVCGKLLHRTEFGGPPLVVLLIGFGAVVCIFSGISDAVFVYRSQNLIDPVSFDTTKLYIGSDDALTAIPLGSIAYIRLSYSRLNNYSRGFHWNYVIGYDLGGIAEEVKVAVYRRSNKDLTHFKQSVKQANPDVEIKNWALNV